MKAATLTGTRIVTIPDKTGTLITNNDSATVVNAMIASGISAAKTDANFGDQDGVFYGVGIGRGGGAIASRLRTFWSWKERILSLLTMKTQKSFVTMAKPWCQ